jgi:RimJ/RimL family protein N-acetyltransferase
MAEEPTSRPSLAVREVQERDIAFLVHYWLDSDRSFLEGMGVDLAKLPERYELTEMLSEQLNQSYPEKKSYCIIWQVDGQPVGHSNINKIIFGQEAYMHLHLWEAGIRQRGYGTELVRMTLPYFFENFNLKKLYCEPYALNPAPNKTLTKIGFTFLKEYTTIPGSLNFEQPVKRWELGHETFQKWK